MNCQEQQDQMRMVDAVAHGGREVLTAMLVCFIILHTIDLAQ